MTIYNYVLCVCEIIELKDDIYLFITMFELSHKYEED